MAKGGYNLYGDKNPNWRGGISTDRLKFMNMSENRQKMAQLRKVVVERDGYKCKNCGTTEGPFDIHHIISFKECPSAVFLPMNAITLCKPCHHKTENYGAKAIKDISVNAGSIAIRFIPHKFQSYETVGNYQETEDGTLVIFISDTGKEIYNMAVLIHELTELALLRHKGIVSFEDVDKFDNEFEEKRTRGEVGENDEPGMAEDCPYRQEHLVASGIEMMLIAYSGESWKAYEDAIYEL